MNRPAKVLFIEDNELDRRAFLRLVRDKRLPWEVEVAETLAAARACLAKSCFDVIVADNHLPDGESPTLFGEIPDIPFVLVTGTLEEQLALRTLERGADDYLIKDPEHRYLEALPFAVEKTLYRQAIHEREKRLTRELRESEQRLRATFDNAASGIVQTDNEGRFVAVNDRLCQMLGYRREELLGMTVHDLSYPEDRPRSDELNAQLREGRLPTLQYEKRYLKRDGSPLWVQVAVSAVRDEAGRYLYSVGTVVDISARKAAEAQVRLQAAALEAAPNAISLSKTDAEGTIVWVNHAFADLTGYSADEAVGHSHHILSSGQQHEAFYRELWETISRGEVWRGELVNRRKDGTLYHEEMGITPLRDENGKITHYIAIKQDITERKRVQELLEHKLEELRATREHLARQNEELQASRADLERERARYQELFDFAPDAYLVTDLNGHVQEMNLAACQLFRQTRSFLLQLPLLQFVAREDKQKLRDLLSRFQRGRTRESESLEVSLRPPRREPLPCALTINAVKELGGGLAGLRWLLRDITERKKAEEELLRAKAELSRANADLERRVEERTVELRETITELEQMSYSMVHDLRAPLRAIQSFGSIVAEDPENRLTEESRELISQMRSASDRMDHLVRDVLNYGRVVREDLPLGPVDIGALARGILETYPNLRSSGAQVRVALDIPLVLGNPAALTQCLSQLLGNAVKFAKPGQTPRIQIKGETRDHGRVRIVVEDNGVGIAPEAQDKVFGMFQQLRNTGEGTGMGLAIVKKAAERMGGRVGVDSEPGRGSRFWIELKAADLPVHKNAESFSE